jgi:polysaccharide export outer membrane protein
MQPTYPAILRLICGAMLLCLGSGCQLHPSTPGVWPAHAEQLAGPLPSELAKTTLPAYRIEPPDILRVEVMRLVPRAPYRLKTLDSLSILARGAFEEEPINGVFQVEPDGLIRLGFSYGQVSVEDLTIDEAKEAIEQHLMDRLRDPLLTVALAQMAPLQPIAGEHLVTPDGTINLGVYGSVMVTGLTMPEAKAAIEAHLARFLDSPEIAVDVFAYNSKRYYVILQGAGLGDVVYTFPVTGNETVLDAVSQVNGLQSFSSKNIWIARPSPAGNDTLVLPVDWKAVTSVASTGTNYQILPGDRLFVAEDKQVAFNTWVDKVVSPWERIMGFSILGATTATRFSGAVLQGGGNPQGPGF